MTYTKTPVTLAEVTPLCQKFDMDQLLASIFVRRGITKSSNLLYYLEDDIRFEHSPFLFSGMEDAVERILAAIEEGEKVLIFGDRDVDGITSTAILYRQLKNMGLDASWRLPLAEEAYGLSMEAVDDFAKENGTLIITVDCGISNAPEIAYAAKLGIDVIVTDHHNPPEVIPDAVAIIDPKCPDSGYPFDGISGAAVAYKLVSALRFSSSDFFNTEICLMDIQENTNDQCFYITCTKIRNLTKRRSITEKIIPGITSISETRLPDFLSGQYIYVWDNTTTTALFHQLFGKGIEIGFIDLRKEVQQFWPTFGQKKAADLPAISKSARYSEIPENQIITESLFNLFVTYVNVLSARKNKNLETLRDNDLQLVGIAALADIMPMTNENRLFVNSALKAIKTKGPVTGLAELFAKLSLDYHYITSKDLGWTVIPALNASGRLGQSNLSLELLISEMPKERDEISTKIIDLNEMRKTLVNEAAMKTSSQVQESLESFDGKLCVVLNEEIHKGVTGILANKIMNTYQVPSLAITENDGIYAGSMRSCRGIVATDFLKDFGDFFIAYGGHNAAAGFSFTKDKLPQFMQKAKELSARFELQDKNAENIVDAEIPANYITPDLLRIIDMFEPYGNGNDELLFVSQNLPVCDGMIVGKKEPYHLKLTFDCGKYKFPAMFWSAGDKWNKEVKLGSRVNVLFSVNKNIYNGNITTQMFIKEMEVNKN
ncbi:MAG: single-stranded-DNA-specific exonuclease RecJ [Treponema sp.]|nr:single-stranded-DNA-specific exonuclease RecJ [Treponema sp.]